MTLTAANPVNLNVDCGYVCNGQIGDFVWYDANGNGCQDAGEPGIPGVQVSLYSGACGTTGTLIATTATDSTGHYLFSGLCPGAYQVAITTPAGFTATTPNKGCKDTTQPPYTADRDSKCNCGGASPCITCVTLTVANPVNLNVDCGYLQTCVCLNSFNSAGTAAGGFISLGTASKYGVLGLKNTQINNSNVTITGNLGVSQGGTVVNMAPSTITGNVYEYASGQYSGPGTLGGSIIVAPATLTQNDADALNASSTASALTPDFTFGNITTTTTVTATAASRADGVTVVNINGSINLNNASLILSGLASDVFVVNVTGSATFGGSGGLMLAGGVTPNHVLYNFTGSSGTISSHVGNTFYGTLLAPNYSFNLDGAFVGEIIGGGSSIVIMSGATVNNPCPCGSPN